MTQEPAKELEWSDLQEAAAEVERLRAAIHKANAHKFVSDWYRPARCQACGYRREHPSHKS